jgi:hypothetical protein
MLTTDRRREWEPAPTEELTGVELAAAELAAAELAAAELAGVETTGGGAVEEADDMKGFQGDTRDGSDWGTV